MNYRHQFHAGNFADVAKHALLVVLLEALNKKPAAWCYYDTHAGAGGYDLESAAARKTGESDAGIRHLWSRRGSLPAPLERLCRIVADLNPGLQDGEPPRYYPGSPWVAAALSREQDRLVLAELHENEADLLKQRFRGDKRVAVHERDGYEMLQALIPPAEKRGLALLDPPYEDPGEFETLAAGLIAAAGRWPGGVYALWYPLKEETSTKRFLRAVERSGLRKLLLTELRLPTTPGALAGSGLLILNPPWGMEAPMRECLEALARELGPKGSSAEVRWLVPE